jgi:serine/threonine-protein kinase
MTVREDAMIGRIILGRYRIVRALAKGGMGVVYLGRGEGAVGFVKPVVIKRMASDLLVDPSMARMFVREARLMSRLRHPNIVGVIDFGEEHGDYLMVIEYVHGYHLGQWGRFARQAYGGLPPDVLVHVVIKVLDALHYAHELRGDDDAPLHIVHRDVSPANVLIDVEGHVKLADFGVARSRDQTEQTEASTIKGKMPYLAPELFKLEEPSPSSDAYACAVVLHEMLVGQNEFRAQDVATTVSRVLEHVPTDVDRVRDDLPRGLGTILKKALAKTREERFANAGELAAALRSVRPGTEEELQARLVSLARRDFYDASIASLLGFSSLAEREDAWKNPPKVGELPMPRISSSPPTIAAKPSDLAIDVAFEGSPTKKASPWPWIAGAIVGVAAVAAGAWAFVGRGNGADVGEQPTFVVVQPTGAADDAGEESEAVPPDEIPEADAGVARSDEPEPRVGPIKGTRPSAGSLTRAFNRRQGEVLACIRRNPSEAPAGGQIEVVFQVAADGRVTNASLEPASLGSTTLGRCVLGIATSTRFPAQAQAVRFRIPVRVQGI